MHPSLEPLLRHAALFVATANGDTESIGPVTMSRSHWALAAKLGSIVVSLGIAIVLVRLMPLLERIVTRFASAHGSPRDATASVIDTQRRVETLTKITTSIARALIWSITLITVLGDIGIAVGPLLATAGIAGVAIGFGAQSIVKDFFSGFFILLENQFDVGDTITVNTVTGVVERMTMRITVVRDTTGTAHFFPNSNVVNVANKTYGWVRAALDASFATTVPTNDARAAMESVISRVENHEDWKRFVTEPGRIEGPVDLAGGAVTYRIALRVRAGFADDLRAALILALADEMNHRGWKMTGNVIG
jgi:small conductance mechanosensitive channel